jgi:hypothetical protein
LKRLSNWDFGSLAEPGDPVRFPVASSTIRAAKDVQLFGADLSDTWAVIGARHSQRAPESKCWHALHA